MSRRCTWQQSLIPSRDYCPEYLRYYLVSAKEYAESLASGTTFKELSATRMANLAIPVPPLPEQHQIVAKLDSLTGRTVRARENLGRIPRLIQKYREAILSAAFGGDLTIGLLKRRRQSKQDVKGIFPDVEALASETLHPFNLSNKMAHGFRVVLQMSLIFALVTRLRVLGMGQKGLAYYAERISLLGS